MAEIKAQAEAQHVHMEEPKHISDTVIMGVDPILKRFQEHQQSLTLGQAFRQSWKPILWCTYMFFLCIMYGYDALVGSVVVAIPQFRQDFGYDYNGQYTVSAAWQLAFQAGFFLGMIISGGITGPLVKRFGRKYTILLAYVVNLGGVFLQYFAISPAEFFGSKILTGMPLGTFATIAPTYAAEMAPLPLRGILTAGMNFAIVMGNLIGYGAVQQTGFYAGKAQYRIVFAVQWGFIGVGLLALPFVPESPFWLISHGKEEEARRVVTKLHKPDYDVEGRILEIHTALQSQQQDMETQGRTIECFNKDNWRRTMVATMMFFIQNACGTGWVIGYMSYFMQLAGMPTEQSFSATVGIQAVMLVGNMGGWLWVEWLGRRKTALYGAAILCATLFIIGILAVVSAPGALTAQVVLMGVWAFTYQGTLGAAAWPISAENATSSLRVPTQALCTLVNGLSASIWGLSLPYAVNPDQGNLQGKIAFVYAALMAFAVVFIFFMVPETKGRPYEEIDALWKSKVPPRKFAQHKLNTMDHIKAEHE